MAKPRRFTFRHLSLVLLIAGTVGIALWLLRSHSGSTAAQSTSPAVAVEVSQPGDVLRTPRDATPPPELQLNPRSRPPGAPFVDPRHPNVIHRNFHLRHTPMPTLDLQPALVLPSTAPSQEPLDWWFERWTGKPVLDPSMLPLKDTGTIPKRLFMTWKAKALNPQAYDLWEEWGVRERLLDRVVLDDAECARLAEIFPDLKPRYDGLPLNVMRADICRVLAIYYFGGLYKDVDVGWMRPLKDWVNYEDHVAYGWEDDEHLCQWFFAARPGDRCVWNILQHITNIIANTSYIDFNANIEAVIDITGPGVWTDAMQGCPTPSKYTVNEMKFTNVEHHYASQRWGGKEYKSWIDSRRGRGLGARVAAVQAGAILHLRRRSAPHADAE
jgi:hypothetical protein